MMMRVGGVMWGDDEGGWVMMRVGGVMWGDDEGGWGDVG